MSTLNASLICRLMHQPALVKGARCEKIVYKGIIGLQVGTGRVQEFPDYERCKEGSEIINLPMPVEVTTRLAQFTSTHYVDCLIPFHCHSFVCFMMGWGASNDVDTREYKGSVVDPRRLLPFQPYALLRGGPGGSLMHSVIAVTSTVTMGVNGNNSPLILAEISDLMDLYGADTLLQARGSCISAN